MTRLGNGLTFNRWANDIDDQYWELDVDDDEGFNLKLSLDDGWGFKSSLKTKIIIDIDSDDDDDWCSSNHHWCSDDKDIIIAFTQNGVDSYFITWLNLRDENQFIYPNCSTNLEYNQSYASGDIKSLIDAYNPNENRLEKAGGAESNYEVFTEIKSIKYPFTIILENDPLQNYMLFSFINDDDISSCGFMQMKPDIGLVLYFASEEPSDSSFEIQSINVTHVYDEPVVPPSNNPTNAPTISIQSSFNFTINTCQLNLLQFQHQQIQLNLPQFHHQQIQLNLL